VRKRAEMETAGQQRQRRPPQLSDSCLITSATAPLTDLGVFGDSPCGGEKTERDRDPPGNATRTRLLSSTMVVSVPAVVVALAKPNSSFPCFVWWRRPSFHVASDRAWPGVLRARVATACLPNCDASRSRWPPHQRRKWPLWCLLLKMAALFGVRAVRTSDRNGRLGVRSRSSKGRSLFFLAALNRAEAAAIGRSLRSLFRALAFRNNEPLCFCNGIF